MTFTVVWLPSAEVELENLWLSAPDKAAVTRASNLIDRELANNPFSKTTRIDNLHSMRRDPLVVLCEIDLDDRMVCVIEVHRRITE